VIDKAFPSDDIDMGGANLDVTNAGRPGLSLHPDFTFATPSRFSGAGGTKPEDSFQDCALSLGQLQAGSALLFSVRF
jgi:hypothetical protein